MTAWLPFVPFRIGGSEAALVQIFHDNRSANGHSGGAGPGGLDGVANGIGTNIVEGIGIQAGGVVGDRDVPNGRRREEGGREGGWEGGG